MNILFANYIAHGEILDFSLILLALAWSLTGLRLPKPARCPRMDGLMLLASVLLGYGAFRSWAEFQELRTMVFALPALVCLASMIRKRDPSGRAILTGTIATGALALNYPIAFSVKTIYRSERTTYFNVGTPRGGGPYSAALQYDTQPEDRFHGGDEIVSPTTAYIVLKPTRPTASTLFDYPYRRLGEIGDATTVESIYWSSPTTLTVQFYAGSELGRHDAQWHGIQVRYTMSKDAKPPIDADGDTINLKSAPDPETSGGAK